ncbi:helix-turn-helix domain-containing protein [Streptomyces sp. NPDC088350]|uniref:helix-turn-helix domain-containing protein n=1 Tax=Streptomyces sp. NPDC088350 TaxID=3365854 RepID=UPI00381AE5AD
MNPRQREFLHVAIHVRGPISVFHDGGEVFLNPGDLVFYDPHRPGFAHFGEHVRMTVIRIPRHCPGIAESDLRRIMGVPLSCQEGVRTLVSNFLSVLAREAEFRRTDLGDRLARNAADLLAAVVTEFAGEPAADPTDGRTRTLSHVRSYVELHLADPDLSPESIAFAHNISVRYLHKLFQHEGTTVSRLIRQRRLDACRRELDRARHRRLTVAAVAHRWGFTSPSHFSKAFRDAYGMSPKEWQAPASSDTDTVLTGPTSWRVGERPVGPVP